MMVANILKRINHVSKDGQSILPPVNSANNAKEGLHNKELRFLLKSKRIRPLRESHLQIASSFAQTINSK